jgi:hypothetical protein
MERELFAAEAGEDGSLLERGYQPEIAPGSEALSA